MRRKLADKLAKRHERRAPVFEAPTRRPGSMGQTRDGGNVLRAFWNSRLQLKRASQACCGVAFLLAAYMGGLMAMRLPMLDFRSVQVMGDAPHVQREQIAQLVNGWRGNFLTLDLEQARRDVAGLAWVKQANVARRWPAQLLIEVVEHQPLAHWGRRGLVDADGVVFAGELAGDLPRLHGPEEHAAQVVEHYHLLTQMLAPIGARPVAVRLSPRMAWEAELDNGIKLELGRTDFEERMQTFLTAYRVELHNIATRPLTVDLRYKRGLALQSKQLPKPEKPAKKSKKEKGAAQAQPPAQDASKRTQL